jgi:hypothetical protein
MPADDATDPGATVEMLVAKYGETVVVGARPPCDAACQLAQGALQQLGFKGRMLNPSYDAGPRATTQLDAVAAGYLIASMGVLGTGTAALYAFELATLTGELYVTGGARTFLAMSQAQGWRALTGLIPGAARIMSGGNPAELPRALGAMGWTPNEILIFQGLQIGRIILQRYAPSLGAM